MLDRAPLEVVPEARQPGAGHRQLGEAAAACICLRLCLRELSFQLLAQSELLAIVFGDVLATLALILLPDQVGDERLDQLATGLPQPSQLIEDQRGIGRLLQPQAPLQGPQHLLDALGGALLLLDTVLEPVDLFLQFAVGLLELGAIAEQGENAAVLNGRLVLAKGNLQEIELLQRLQDRNRRSAPGNPRCGREAMASLHTVLQPLI